MACPGIALPSPFFSSFGVLQLMLPEAPQPSGLLYYPRIGLPTFPTSSALPRSLIIESWSCEPVIPIFPTFATSRLREIIVANLELCGGEKWPVNLAWNARLPCSIQGSFTCNKYTTWDPQIYFPSEGRRAEDFFVLKNPMASAGGSKGQHATSSLPKPLIFTFTITSLGAATAALVVALIVSGTSKYLIHSQIKFNYIK
jgi:hypothetical protein